MAPKTAFEASHTIPNRADELGRVLFGKLTDSAMIAVLTKALSTPEDEWKTHWNEDSASELLGAHAWLILRQDPHSTAGAEGDLDTAFAEFYARFCRSWGVGTEKDYDFVLQKIILLISACVNRPQSQFSNVTIRRLLFQHEARVVHGEGEAVRAYHPPGLDSLVGTLPETENHVLMIHVWKWFIGQYLKLQAELPDDHPRRDEELVAEYEDHPSLYGSGPRKVVTEALSEAFARFLYNGSFEHSARPYQSYSVLAMLTAVAGCKALRSLADVALPEVERMERAATNALEFVLITVAFQSSFGRRSGPFRRRWSNRGRWAVGQNDYLIDILWVLSGNAPWSRWPAGGETGSSLPARYSDSTQGAVFRPNKVGQAAEFAYFTGLACRSGYRPANALLDLLVDQRPAWFSRIATTYTTSHYALHQGARYFDLEDGKRSRIRTGDPRATIEFHTSFEGWLLSSGGLWAGSEKQQLQLGAGDLARLQALVEAAPTINGIGGGVLGILAPLLDPLGGIGTGLLPWAGVATAIAAVPGVSPGLANWFAQDKMNDLNIISVPLLLFPPGDVGRTWGDGAVGDDVLSVKGQATRTHEGRNFWVYRNFCYAYYHDGADRHIDWAERAPPGWGRLEAQIAPRCSIRVYEPPRSEGSAELYVVVGKVSKQRNKGVYREYARVFIELVPRAMFASREAVLAEVRRLNDKGHFPDYRDRGERKRNYRYTLVTNPGETVLLDDRIGSSEEGFGLQVQDKDGRDIGAPYLYTVGDNPLDVPLLEAWRVDPQTMRFSESKSFCRAVGDGKLTLSTREHHLYLDSSDPLMPARSDRKPAIRWQG